MSAELLIFLFGLCAGFVLTRLGRGAPLARWERKWLRPVGLVLMIASLTFAAILIAWAVIGTAAA